MVCSQSSSPTQVQGFVGEKVFYIDGDAGSNGASYSQIYQGFAIAGQMLGAFDGFVIRGNALDNVFRNIQIRQISRHGVVLGDGTVTATNGPNANLFEAVWINTTGGDGFVIGAGHGNKFVNCDAETLAGKGFNITSGTGGTWRILLDNCWVEAIGDGETGIFASGVDELEIHRCNVTGFGSTPATTGHGIHLAGCVASAIIGTSFSGRAASVAGSRKIYVDGGSGLSVEYVESITTADIEFDGTAADSIVRGVVGDSRIQTLHQIITSNAHAALAAAGTPRYIQLGTGYDSNAVADVETRVSGRLSLRGMRITAPASPGVGQSYILTLVKNAVNTAMSISVTSTNFADASDFTHQVECVDGDRLCLEFGPTATAAAIPRGQLRISIGERM